MVNGKLLKNRICNIILESVSFSLVRNSQSNHPF